ncbi:hypothetical protein J3L16_05605 [Alteromonas sp. 5E99-2]|uniref:hypothetical protein n=1 Tax=Alteromonas sp. 5E99-2 TaxID=2817683 RepID=UPI001A98D3AC|nr:hypothetical protein [Alteromonas sp. 5E99-2]MBO1255163.1 hypothetical protein [Alteromonas sp. 5E99-2]
MFETQQHKDAKEKVQSCDVLPAQNIDPIQSLRSSVKSKDVPKNTIQKRPEVPVSNVEQVIKLTETSSPVITDIQTFFEDINMALPNTKEWQVDDSKPILFSSSLVSVPFQLTALSASQKKSLWKAMCKCAEPVA